MIAQVNGTEPCDIMEILEREETEVDSEGTMIMAKKKSGGGRKTLPVRIDAHVVRRAQNVAKDRGVPLSDYVTEILKAAVERDWNKILRRLVSEEDEK